jgi:hypothetical protein
VLPPVAIELLLVEDFLDTEALHNLAIELAFVGVLNGV